MSAPRLSARIVAPTALVLGMLAASALFARGHGFWGGRAVAGHTVASGRARSRASAPAAAPAGPVGGVATLFEERVASLETRLAQRPEDKGLILELARLLHDGHRVEAAVPLYRRALELDRTDAQVFYDLAAAYGAVGAWEDAAGALMDRLDDDPGDAVALYNLGAVRANQGRREDAALLLDQARKATSDGALLARIAQALSRLKAS